MPDLILYSYRVIGSETLKRRFCAIIYLQGEEISRQDGWRLYANAETWAISFINTK